MHCGNHITKRSRTARILRAFVPEGRRLPWKAFAQKVDESTSNNPLVINVKGVQTVANHHVHIKDTESSYSSPRAAAERNRMP